MKHSRSRGRMVMRVALAALAALAMGVLLPDHAGADVDLIARVSRSQLSVGESTTLEVVVRGATSGIGQPEFDVPAGMEVLATSRAQSFSWVNGRSTVETVFRYEIAPTDAGTFAIGPVRIRVGTQRYESRSLSVEVTAASRRLGGSGIGSARDDGASLIVDVEPSRPYVGQPVIMRVRLVQRAKLAEDPRYVPPSTSGFWSEDASRPESFYADQGRQRVLVTETRMRMYPIAPGTTTIGEAVAGLALAIPGASVDPLQWLRGRVPRREVTVRSRPVDVPVRSLPAGAPAGFDGAVGDVQVRWSADRRTTSLDVPLTLRLDIRGIANLPLIQSPELESDDFEIFTSVVEDSLPPAGRLATGRRSFIWTALAKREGRLSVKTPPFAWFDPDRDRYVTAEISNVTVDVGPALSADAAGRDGFPRVFAEHPADPFQRRAMPWAWALAGLAAGAGIALWRQAARPARDSAERARQREWLRVVGLANGPDFWRAAEEAMAWVESRGGDVRHLMREISAARYGGSTSNTESVRRRVVERLSQALAPAPARWPLRAAAGALWIAAITACILLGPSPGSDAGVSRARFADDAARKGDVASARDGWTSLWREGGHQAGIAARLAWAAAGMGEVGPAAAWVLRGERVEGRDAALSWVRERVREAGGLAGASPAHLPVRTLEWAVAALVLGIAAGAFWPGRRAAGAFTALALALALVQPLETWRVGRYAEGVVQREARLEGPDLSLEPGHVVRVLERNGARVRVSAGRGVEGELEGDLLLPVGDTP